MKTSRAREHSAYNEGLRFRASSRRTLVHVNTSPTAWPSLPTTPSRDGRSQCALRTPEDIDLAHASPPAFGSRRHSRPTSSDWCRGHLAHMTRVVSPLGTRGPVDSNTDSCLRARPSAIIVGTSRHEMTGSTSTLPTTRVDDLTHLTDSSCCCPHLSTDTIDSCLGRWWCSLPARTTRWATITIPSIKPSADHVASHLAFYL